MKKICALLFFALFAALLPAQPLFQGRPEDQAALARRLAAALAAAREGGVEARRRMLPHLLEAAAGLPTREFGRVLDGLDRAVAAGRERGLERLHRIRGATFLHALPEVQGVGKKARIHLTARLLLKMELPPRLAVDFRIRRRTGEAPIATATWGGEMSLDKLLGVQVVESFSLADLPPGRYLAEVQYRRAEEDLAGAPILASQRAAFYLLPDFDRTWRGLGERYGRLLEQAAFLCLSPRMRRGIYAVMGPIAEIDRTVNPDRGGPPLVEVDQLAMYERARRWVDLLEKEGDPLQGLVGDQLLGVATAEGTMMPMRVLVPEGLPPRGRRRALLFLPAALGGEADLMQVYGKGDIEGLAAREKVIVACLRTAYLASGEDIVGPARDLLVAGLGADPRGVTLGGHGRGASQAYYAALEDPAKWAGLVLVSGPPANPARLAPIPGQRTFYLEGAESSDLRTMAAARDAARQGKVRFELVPAAEHFLALACGLDRVIAFAAGSPKGEGGR